MKLIANLKLTPTPTQANALSETLKTANAACNWLSDHAWATKTFGQFALHRLTYAACRTQFALSAQMAARCIAKVADAYKLDRKTRRRFRRTAAQPYDDRIFRFCSDTEVSLWTVNGRLTIPYQCGPRQRALLAYRKGEVDLMLVKGVFYLAVVCDVPDPEEIDIEQVLGIDLGIVNLAVDSDGTVYTGTEVEQTHGLAWLAGLLDGEGYFGIRHSKGRDGKPKWFKPVITLGMTSEAACRKAHEVTNRGSVRLLPRRTTAGKAIWEWQVTTREAVEVCQLLLPYLTVKRANAETILKLGILIAMRPYGCNTAISASELQERLLLKQAIHALNL